MPKVAVLFWGITRSLKTTIVSIKKNIFDVLTENEYTYDTFIHTYKINGPYANMVTKEKTESYNNEDIESLLQPTHYIFDNQEDIINQIDFNSYYTKLGNWTNHTPEVTRYLIRNMILALYSKKQITELFETLKSNYDYVIFTRPDIDVLTPLDINIFTKLNPTYMFIPSDDWYKGYNDRFAVCMVESAIYYGKLFDPLLEYSRNKSIISERYLRDMLDKKQIKILKTPIKLVRKRIEN